MESVEKRVENGECMVIGECRVENGEWRAKSGNWRIENREPQP